MNIKKVKGELKKLSHHHLGLAIGINLFFLIMILVFCEVKYEVSDDFVMASILSGAYGGELNPHMIFINVLWGYFLMPLYRIFPGISWYLIGQLFLCFLSFTAVTYMLLERLEIWMALVLSVVFITSFSNDAYILVQFTKTASLAVMSGSLLFLWGVFHLRDKQRRKIVISGGFLVLAGSLIRYNSIYIAGGFILGIVIIEFVRMFLKQRKEIFGKGIKIAAIGMILIFAVQSGRWIDKAIYNSDKEYNYFKEYNAARANIVDWPDYGYWMGELEYKEMGLSEQDYFMMRTWNFADNKVFNLGVLESAGEKLKEIHSEVSISITSKVEEIKSRGYLLYPVVWACIILLVLSIVLNKTIWWTSLAACCVGGMYLVYFFVSGRVVYRVEYAVFSCVFLAIIYFFEKEGCKDLCYKQEVRQACAILVVLCMGLQILLDLPNHSIQSMSGKEYEEYVEDMFYKSWDYDSRRYGAKAYKKDGYKELNEEMRSDSEKFYFMDFNTTIQTLYFQYSPWKTLPKQYYKNKVYMTGITSGYPEVVKILEKNDISNPMESLVEKDVYVIDNLYIDAKLEYIKKHYYPNARVVLYKEIDGYKIWKFYKE